ncbi:alpha-hydroxy-acid oxidizing protein [Rhodococcus ruber]|nr:alpha-hydroxy-acid oxidizing protein [Rhodococcus ruber]
MLDLRFPKSDPAERVLDRCPTIEDLREAARVRTPRPVFDFVDGAAGTESGKVRALEAFDRVYNHPGPVGATAGIDIDLSVEVFGKRQGVPLVLGPTGFTRLAHTAGESAVAKAAGAAGIPYTLSTPATCSIEDIARIDPRPDLWFQLYVLRDRALTLDLVRRAETEGYRVLVLTVDTPVAGDRRRDSRNGFSIPAKVGFGSMVRMARHPGWLTGAATSEPLDLASFPLAGKGDMWSRLQAVTDSNFGFDEISWVRAAWDGPLVVKGILDPQLARRAVDLGADGVVVSNHGGRQLDRTVAPLDALEPIVDAVGADASVFLDGGVREGADIAAAVALGATAVFVGRPYLYGLMAAGERGVGHAIEIFRHGLDHHLRLLGVDAVAKLDRRHVTLAPSPLGDSMSTRFDPAAPGTVPVIG